MASSAWLAQLRVGEGGFSLHHHHFSASSHIRIRERKPVTSNMDPSAAMLLYDFCRRTTTATVGLQYHEFYHLRLDGQTRRVVVPLFVCRSTHSRSSHSSQRSDDENVYVSAVGQLTTKQGVNPRSFLLPLHSTQMVMRPVPFSPNPISNSSFSRFFLCRLDI